MNDCELIFFQCPGLKVSDCCCYCGICVTLIVDRPIEYYHSFCCCWVVLFSMVFSTTFCCCCCCFVQDKDTKRSRNRIDRQAILLGTFNNNELLLGYSETKLFNISGFVLKLMQNCLQFQLSDRYGWAFSLLKTT